MNKNILLILFLFLLCTQLVFAKQAPTMPISYNTTSINARSFAMGQTGVAMPADIGGVALNPASLGYTSTEKIQAEFMIGVARESDKDLDKNEISKVDAIDLGLQSFVVSQQQGAISWRTLSSNEIVVNDGDKQYKKHERIKAITVSIANRTESNTSLGLNISYLYGTISESNTFDKPFAQSSYGNGFTIDIGLMKPLYNNLFFGINLENIVGFMWWDEYTHDQLPFGIRTGLGYCTGTFNLLFDYTKHFYRFGDYKDNLFAAGLEQYINNILCIRLGISAPDLSDKESIKYTYGLGLNISIVSLSLAGESYKINDESISKYVMSLKVLI